MRRQQTPRSVSLFMFVFGFTRLLSRLGRTAAGFADTPGYLSFEGWNTRRPWTVPIINTLAVNNSGRVWANVVIAVICWSLLAREVAKRVPEPWAGLTASAILMFALSFRITEWDFLLLSESGALSFGALWIVMLLRWFDDRSRRHLVALGVVSLVWTQTRESSVAAVGATVGLIAAKLLIRRMMAGEFITGLREAGVVLVVVGSACGASLVIAHQANTQPYLTPLPTLAKHRGVTLENYRFMDVLGQRLMFDPKAVQFMLAEGMPAYPVTNNLVGFSAADQDFRMYDDATFVRWVDEHGQRAYLKYLLSEPKRTVTLPFTQGTNIFAPDIDYYFARPRRLLPTVIEDLWWPKATTTFLLPISMIVAIVARDRQKRESPGRSTDAQNLITVGATVSIGSVVATMVNWHGAWLESARHVFISNATMRVGLLLSIIGTVTSVKRLQRLNSMPISMSPSSDVVTFPLG